MRRLRLDGRTRLRTIGGRHVVSFDHHVTRINETLGAMAGQGQRENLDARGLSPAWRTRSGSLKDLAPSEPRCREAHNGVLPCACCRRDRLRVIRVVPRELFRHNQAPR